MIGGKDIDNGLSASGKLREINQDQFEVIRADHLSWLHSRGRNGNRLTLPMTDLTRLDIPRGTNLGCAELAGSNLAGMLLSGIGFEGANLAYANFTGARLLRLRIQHNSEPDAGGMTLKSVDFSGSNLTEAKFDKAITEGALFREADLKECRLFHAQFVDADFTDAKNLLSSQFAGSKMIGAKLPEAVARFDALSIAAESARSLKRVLTALMLLCVYSWISVSTASPVETTKPVTLPIIGVEMPVTHVFLVAPLVILVLHIHLLLNLQRMWEIIGTLPAFFTDGRPLDRTLHPWFLNGLVRAHSPLLRGHRFPFSYFQSFITVAVIWLVPLMTIAMYWFSYLQAANQIVTRIHICAVTYSTVFGVLSYVVARRTLRGSPRKPYVWGRMLNDWRTAAVLLASMALILLLDYFS